ncbi:unnamed protein product [Trichobilharzia regenti]|nr:unnamed protein product [Trichobilharzia regenti]
MEEIVWRGVETVWSNIDADEKYSRRNTEAGGDVHLKPYVPLGTQRNNNNNKMKYNNHRDKFVRKYAGKYKNIINNDSDNNSNIIEDMHVKHAQDIDNATNKESKGKSVDSNKLRNLRNGSLIALHAFTRNYTREYGIK